VTAQPASESSGTGLTSRPAATLLAVWAVTLIALASVVLWLELTYTPPAAEQGQPEAAEVADPTAVPVPSEREEVSEATLPEDARPSDEAENIPTEDAQSATVSDEVPQPSAGVGAATEEQQQTAEIRLAPAPAPDLVQQTNAGLQLPIIGEAGRAPWKIYSRPFLGNADAPRIALVIQGIGLNADTDRSAMEQLPPEVTFAVSPYAETPQDVADRARAAGHEVLLMLPMEPFDYPDNDPGPLTLLVDMPQDEMIDRLHRILGRFQGYVGVVNHMGSRFTSDRTAFEPVVTDLARRGLLVLDARTSADSVLPVAARTAGLPTVVNDRYIDNDASAVAIDRLLDRLLQIAREEGAAVGIGRPYPVTLARISSFAERLAGTSVVLTPLSAVVGIRDGGGRTAAR